MLTVNDVLTTCVVVMFRVRVSCITSVETLVIGQIGQLSLNVIGHLSLKL